MWNNEVTKTQLPLAVHDDVINRNIFRVTRPLCGDFTDRRWIPLTKASNAELWCFLWINGWVNNRDAGDLRRHRAHYEVFVMSRRQEKSGMEWGLLNKIWTSNIYSYWHLFRNTNIADITPNIPIHYQCHSSRNMIHNQQTIIPSQLYNSELMSYLNKSRCLFFFLFLNDGSEVVSGYVAAWSWIALVFSVWSSWFFLHDDVIKWKHFPRYWPFVRGIHRSPVNSPHKGQWRGALMFTLICARTNGWVNNREAGDLRRYRAHYDVIVMANELRVEFQRTLPYTGKARSSESPEIFLEIPVI